MFGLGVEVVGVGVGVWCGWGGCVLSCWCIRSVVGSVGIVGFGDEIGCVFMCSSVGGFLLF